MKGAAFWAWYDEGQVGPEGEGGGDGLYGIRDTSSTFDIVRSNAKIIAGYILGLFASKQQYGTVKANEQSFHCCQFSAIRHAVALMLHDQKVTMYNDGSCCRYTERHNRWSILRASMPVICVHVCLSVCPALTMRPYLWMSC